jgi:hypothetical protein
MPTKFLDNKFGFTFGCDPEVFLFRDGKPISAEGLIPGTKAEPYPVEFGAVQVDGFAAEFNIEPVTSGELFDHHIAAVMKQLKGMLPKDVSIEILPHVIFDEQTFNNATDKEKELGCSPDYNAWEGKVNTPPNPSDNPYMRTAAGHLHVGFTQNALLSDVQHIMNCCDLVKQFDWYLGAWSCLEDPDPVRRQLYGQAGACRLKDYGVEYRVLSNFWIKSPAYRAKVWNRMMAAINDISKGFMPETQMMYNGALVSYINDTKVPEAFQQMFPTPILKAA